MDPIVEAVASTLGELSLGLMIFIIWYFDQKRQRSLDCIIKNYEKGQAAQVEVERECRDAILLGVQVNTRLVERLDYILKERDRI